MPVRGVLFDAGNTLIRVKSSVGGVYAEVAARHGLAAPAGALDEAFKAAFARHRSTFLPTVSRPHSAAREKAWWRTLVAEVFAEVGGPVPGGAALPLFFDELYDRFEEPDVWEVFPDVFPCLDALERRGLPLGIVSNWDSRLRAVLEGLGLLRRFRFVLVSAEYGAEKPDPSIFREGARRLELAPAEVLHVGDLPDDDVRGATDAGLSAVLLDRSCAPAPPARLRVCTLEDLPELLDV